MKLFREKIKNLEFEVYLSEPDVIVTGEDFERRMDWECFLSYAKGVGSCNEMNAICGVPYRVVFIPHNS